MALNLFLPIGPVVLRDDIVAASDAGRWLSVDRVRFCGAAKACAVLLAIDTESPVANAQCETGLHQELREAAQVLFHLQSTKTRSFGHDVRACAAAKRGSAEHLLPRED